MKTKQLLQELSAWQWELNGFQTAALLIQDRLDVIYKNKAVYLKNSKIGNLLNLIKEQERELNEIEKKLIIQKEILRNRSVNTQWQSILDADQQSLRNYVSKEKSMFASIKEDYFKLLKDLHN
jgi:hypothetical protein